jgi:mannose-6-phosphate isomerase-like protein (cupin superfamily)
MRKRAAAKSLFVARIGTMPGRKIFGKLLIKEIAPRGLLGDVSVVYEKMLPNLSLPTVYHKKTTEFVYCLSGRATAYLAGKAYPMRPGTLLLIPPGARHRFVTRSHPCESLSIFQPALMLADRRPDIHTEPAA